MVRSAVQAMARHSAARLSVMILAMAGACLLLGACEKPHNIACTHQWIGPAGGDFGVEANWDVGTVPGADDVACGPAGATVEITDTRTIYRLNLPTGSVHVTASGTLDIVGVYSQLKQLTIEGTRTGRGSLAIHLLEDAGGSPTFAGDGTTLVLANSHLTGAPRVTGTVKLVLGTAILRNATVHACDGSTLELASVSSTSSTITDAGCAAPGTPTIAAHKGMFIFGDLTMTLPVVVQGCSASIDGTLTTPSYHHVGDPSCGSGNPHQTALSEGTLTAADLHLDGAALRGVGTIKGNVTDAGTIMPGLRGTSTLGTLTIDGNLTATAGTTIEARFRGSPAPASDVLQVTGTATITNASFTATNVSVYEQPAIGASIHAVVAGARIGTFATFTPPPNVVGRWVANYGADGVRIDVRKALPTITWTYPGAILAGTPLSPTELNATADIAGTFAYTPPLGTVLPVGGNRALSVTFHPADTATYEDTTKYVFINVTATAPTVTWAAPAPITRWAPLTAAQLNATASVPGSFFYSPPVGSVPEVGTARPLSVLFVPTNRAVYPTVKRTVAIDVTAPPTLDTFRAQIDTAGPAERPLVADLDGDGRGDVVTVDYYGDTISVLRRTTAGAFAPRVTYPVGDSPSDVVAGDLNGDGWTDLAVADSYTNPGVSVLLGAGGGAFAPKVDVPLGASVYSLAMADFNGDGRLDVGYAGSKVGILWGTGTGTLLVGPSFALPYAGYMIEAADLNADGRPDLAFTRSYPGYVSVMLNAGLGAFAPRVDYATGAQAGALAIGDVTGDGVPDLIAGEPTKDPYFVWSSTNLYVMAGLGDGTFGPKVTWGVGTTPISLSVADIDGDGRSDIVAGTAVGRFVVLHSTGPGTFAAADSYAYGVPGRSTTWGTVGDVDGDHRPDLVGTGERTSTGGTTSVLFGAKRSNVSWTTPAPITTGTALGATQLNATSTLPGTFAYTPAAGTVLPQGTGQVLTVTFTPTDIATYAPATTTTMIDVTGPGGLSRPTDYRLRDATDNIRTVASGDLNGDGNLDLVSGLYVANAPGNTQGYVLVQLGTATGAFGAPAWYGVGTGQPWEVKLADLNKDGKLDLVVTIDAGSSYGHLAVLMGNGTGGFGVPVLDRITGYYTIGAAIGDVNGDTNPDIVTLSSEGLKLNLGNGAGGFANTVTYAHAGSAIDLAVGDLNGDGRADVVTANTSVASTYLGTATGLAPKVDQALSGVRAVALADVTGDGKLDGVWAGTTSTASVVYVAPGTGTGTFDWAHLWTGAVGAPPMASPFEQPYAVEVADLDQNGKLDIVTANRNAGTVSVLLGSGGGAFKAPSTYVATARPEALAIGDFNKDTKPDVAVSSTTTGKVAVLFGT